MIKSKLIYALLCLRQRIRQHVAELLIIYLHSVVEWAQLICS